MSEDTEYPITIYLHSDTGIDPVGVDCYYEAFPNAVVGYQGTLPFRFNYNDIALIVGPESTSDIMESVERIISIQKYEYLLTMDKRALDFASFLESKNSPQKKHDKHDHDHTNYG